VAVPINLADHLYLPGFEGVPFEHWRDPIWCWCNQCIPSCCMSFFCPCILAGQVAEKMRWMKCCSVVNCAFGSVFLFFMFAFILRSQSVLIFIGLVLSYLAWSLRTRVREQFRIRGDVFSDCLLSFCCPHCVIAQVVISPRSCNYSNCLFRLLVMCLPTVVFWIIFRERIEIRIKTTSHP
jgi:Cys-rich protein (TIGR01571 family)